MKHTVAFSHVLACLFIGTRASWLTVWIISAVYLIWSKVGISVCLHTSLALNYLVSLPEYWHVWSIWKSMVDLSQVTLYSGQKKSTSPWVKLRSAKNLISELKCSCWLWNKNNITRSCTSHWIFEQISKLIEVSL